MLKVTAFHQFLQYAAERRKQGLYRFMVLEESLVVIYGAEHIKKLCSSNVNLSKSDLYNPLLPWLGRGLLTSYGSKWRSRRKMLTPSFHFNILKTFNEMINSHAKELRDKLMRDACETGQPYDILDDVTHSTLDIICDTAMGVKVNALHGENSEYVEALSIIKEGVDDRSRSPIGRLDLIYDRTAVGKRVQKAITLAQDFTIEVIKKRREMRDSGTDYEQKKHQPFLDLLLDCTDEDGLSLTDSDIREEVDTFMFEGHDTTSSGIFFTIYLLGRNLEEQKKCQQELDEAIGNPSKDITMDDLPKLKYLECCIKESMRLLPPVPMFGRKLEEDTTFGEYVVPKGTEVGMLIAALHQDPEQFPDPEKFNPNRFDQLNSELSQQSSVEENSNVRRDPFAYIPFSAGPRNCIGQKFALMELMIVVGTLLLNFNIESTQTREELGLRAALILQPLNGIHVKLTSRH
ncbi:hypothetical protein EB796_000241 [Bugula neritina]|uniref:CYP4V2 n=1 Tax=Bugula neritina TaxID=10212 RepID=A0A7J7KTJ3_BUGNE|nr:hypothetical protein EB796_000241 [Bugula neritina]